ncbi:MAG: DedA family protein [Candidatus Kapaibacterium sp.]|jgi:membrane protein DedA with SNARE-associated domain
MPDLSVEHIIALLQSFPWWGVLLLTFANSYIENILPISPSDVILVFIGTLVGVGIVDFPSTLLWSTAGSSLGFLTMFRVGRSLDRRVVESGKYRFVPVATLRTVESWFIRYGYAVIVINRFLSGTRAVISVLAGMSNLQTLRSTVACTLSALVWNALILYAGMSLGKNWRVVETYMIGYSRAIGVLTALILVALALRKFISQRSGSSKAEASPTDSSTKQGD